MAQGADRWDGSVLEGTRCFVCVFDDVIEVSLGFDCSAFLWLLVSFLMIIFLE